MGKRKKPSAALYLIDLYQICVRVRPLFGLERLVRLAHRKRSGVLYCDNASSITEAITFSESNARSVLFTISHSSPSHSGVYGQPRLNVPNEASADDLKRFDDEGTEIVFSFTPKKGKTFAMESELYKTFDAGHRYVRFVSPNNARIANWELSLDVSAYLRAGYTDAGKPPRCGFESLGGIDARGRPVRKIARNLVAAEKGNGLWQWDVANVVNPVFDLAWELVPGGQSRASQTINLVNLATELSINARLAKDLHNFVLICHYYAAGIRSLSKISPEMITDKSVLNRSLDSIEKVIGAELIERTKGKGLIQITPAGEAVLDWWSQFYMRWTPISAGNS